MVRRRPSKPKAVMGRDRQFWSWAKISLPRDQRDDVIARLMDRLDAEGLLGVDMRPARVQAQVDETIARQIELMPAAFRALHARRGAEMRRRLRLIVTARKRYHLNAKKGSPRRGGTSQRGGHASGRGARQAAQQQQESQQDDEQMKVQQEDENMAEQQGDERMEEQQNIFQAGSVPWSSESSSNEDALPKEPTSPTLSRSLTPLNTRQMDIDAPPPGRQTPNGDSEGPEIQLFTPTYETPRSPLHQSDSPGSPTPTPPFRRSTQSSFIPNGIQGTQSGELSAEERSALRSGQLLEPYEPDHAQLPAPGPETSRRQESEVSEVSTEPFSTPEDAMRRNFHPDENYDDISSDSAEAQGEGAPREAGQSSGDVPEEHPEEHPDEEDSDEDDSDQEGSDQEHPDEEHPDEEDSDEDDSDQEGSDQEHPDEEHPDEEHPDEEHPDEEHPDEEHPDEEYPDEEHPGEEYPEGEHPEEHPGEHPGEPPQEQPQESQPQLPEDDLEEYNSDEYEAERQRYPVTPYSQAHDSQVPPSPEQNTQEQFTQYRHSGFAFPPSGSPTEKAPSSSSSSSSELSLDRYEASPRLNELQPGITPVIPPFGAAGSLADGTIFAYASENSVDDMIQFWVHQLAWLLHSPLFRGRIPNSEIRFENLQELLRPLNYTPERHEIYYLAVISGIRQMVPVTSDSTLVGAVITMQLGNNPIEFFLREKRPSTQ